MPTKIVGVMVLKQFRSADGYQYLPGQGAGFPESEADAMVKAGVANYLTAHMANKALEAVPPAESVQPLEAGKVAIEATGIVSDPQATPPVSPAAGKRKASK